MLHECRPAEVSIVTDPSRLDLDVIHGFLSRSSYWAAGIPRELVARALRHSTCFGAFDGNEQVGFARVISDHATFAYVCDVFVLDSHRGRGVGKHVDRATAEVPPFRASGAGSSSRGTPMSSTASSASARRAIRIG